jgi:hypothetical protein
VDSSLTDTALVEIGLVVVEDVVFDSGAPFRTVENLHSDEIAPDFLVTGCGFTGDFFDFHRLVESEKSAWLVLHTEEIGLDPVVGRPVEGFGFGS